MDSFTVLSVFQTPSLPKFHEYLCRKSYQFFSEYVLCKLLHALFAFLNAFSKSSSHGSDHWEASWNPPWQVILSLTALHAFLSIHWHSIAHSNHILQLLGIHPSSAHWASTLCVHSSQDIWNWKGIGLTSICALSHNISSCVTTNYSLEMIHWFSL